MGNRESDTLESIIRAAREMAQRRNQERAQKKEAEEQTDHQPVEEAVKRAAEESNPAKDVMAETVLTEDIPTNEAVSSSLLTSEKTIGELMDELGTSPEPRFTPPDPQEEPIDFSDTESLLSAAKTFSDTLQTAGVHFLEFSVAFLSMVKRHYQQDGNDVRANSLAFFALIALDSWSNDHYTMSDLAEKLQIPKQQLTKLINDLETKGLVERIHDTENRRRVYIRICDAGRALMDEVKQEMLQSTLHGLRSYSREELLEMDRCICQLTELMEKFNTEPL